MPKSSTCAQSTCNIEVGNQNLTIQFNRSTSASAAARPLEQAIPSRSSVSVNVPKMSTTRTEDYSNVAPQLTAAMLQQLQRPLPQLNSLAAQFSSPMMYGTAQVPKSAAPVPQYSSYLPTPPDMTVESALAAKCREVQRSQGNPTVPHRTALTARHCTALLCILAHALPCSASWRMLLAIPLCGRSEAARTSLTKQWLGEGRAQQW